MCKSDPQAERRTAWGFTEEDILHRWDIHQQFDTLNRLFGSDKKKKKKTDSTQDAPAINSDAMHSLLNKLLEGD